MSTTELEARLTAVEGKVAELQKDLEYAKTRAALQRARDAVDAGQVVPAREAFENFRIKHNIPRA